MKQAGRMRVAVMAMVALGACTSQKPAPVVDRSGTAAARPPVVADKPAKREARDGVYTVQRGDTLYSIATAFGVDVRDLARWNELPEGSAVRVGQSLR
ncbi:MAG: LysM peptidoglycan-binding domain-containing protein, partial [Burkholderiaceae bacterium]